jgi:hypothetical protein
MLLTRAGHSNFKALAEQEEELCVLHTMQQPVAAVQQLHLNEEAVAVVHNSS